MSFSLLLCLGWGLPASHTNPGGAAPLRQTDQQGGIDLRALYDVQAYRLDLRVEPEMKRLSGQVTVEALVAADELSQLVLDLQGEMQPEAAYRVDEPLDSVRTGEPGAGTRLEFARTNGLLTVQLGRTAKRGERVSIAIRCTGEPRSRGSFDGFHWAKTGDGRPWVNTSSQGTGSSAWWPCKDSFWHPEDKPERLLVNLTVPSGLYGVSNGRLVGREPAGEGWETFRWRHDYPLETYSVTLNVAPYIVVEQELQLEGLEENGGKLAFIYYVLPEDQEKARVQFAEVPRLLEVFGRAFGPFPFPRSKFGLVQTNFWGMEHSTAVAYGSSFPAWCKQHGSRDRFAGRNQFFDYILIHEPAHEWWGNAVSAADWGDFWIHEGFATYAEGVYVEMTQSREVAERYFAGERRQVPAKGSLYRGKGKNSDEAYGGILYSKGACVLHTLRHELGDDEQWWRSLRAFNLAFRYKNARTEDFRGVLEQETGRDWKQFVEEWVYGKGYPKVTGSVRAEGQQIVIEVENEGTDGTQFHVPLDLAWNENGESRKQRVVLDPGKVRLAIECGSEPSELRVLDLERVLGRHDVQVR